MLCRLSLKEQMPVRILKEQEKKGEDDDKKPGEGRKMTLKGRLRLIDALLYLKISGSLVVASTGVSKCVRENVCPRSLRRACGFLCRFRCLHRACV